MLSIRQQENFYPVFTTWTYKFASLKSKAQISALQDLHFHLENMLIRRARLKGTLCVRM